MSQRATFAAWILLLLLCLIYSGKRVIEDRALASNILGLIPQSADDELYSKAQSELLAASERSFAILLAGSTAEHGLRAAQRLEAALDDANMLPDEDRSGLPRRLAELYRPYRQQLLTHEQRQSLRDSDAQTIAAATLQRLYSPVRSYSPYSFAEDPFNLAGDWQAALLGGGKRFLPSAVPSVLDDGRYWYVVSGELKASPFDTDSQRRLLALLQEFAALDIDLLRSGLVFHAAAGAELAQAEISTVGAGSMLGIVLLVTLVFRSLLAIMAILMVLTASTVAAVAVCLLVFDSLHLVTLAFGSTLLGLAADYCFHFFCKWRASGSAAIGRDLVRNGVLLSFVSSAVAYLLQALSPFPGLQQFAVFITTGLLMACFTVLVTLPYLLRRKTLAGARLAGLFNNAVSPLYRRLASHRLPVVGLLAGALLVAQIALLRHGASDDVRLLNTSGAALLVEEGKVGELTVRVGSQRFFILKGNDEQQILEATERLASALAAATQANGDALLSVARFVPSQKQQRQDHALIQQKLYGPGGALELLCQSLAEICQQARPAALAFDPTLVPGKIANGLRHSLRLDAMRGAGFSLALPLSSELDPVIAAQAAATIESVDYVDNIQRLTGLLAQLRV